MPPAYAQSSYCDAAANHLDKLSSGGYFQYLTQCTDFDMDALQASAGPISGSQSIVAVGANIKINADPPGIEGVSSNTQSEVSIDSCGSSVVSGYNDSEQFSATNSLTGYSHSQNGGTTWTDPGALPPGTGFNFGDPSVKTDSNCDFYFASLHETASIPGPEGGGGDSAITVSKSVNGGVSFGAPVVVASHASDFLDKELLGVGPNPGGGQDIIHIAFVRFENTSPFEFPVEYWRSLDGGATWQDQHIIDLGPNDAQQGAIPVVDPTSGDVYLFFIDFNDSTIKVTRNSNGGAPSSWGAVVPVGTANTIGKFNSDCQRPLWNGDYRFFQFPTGAVNPVNGDIYVSWNDAPQNGPTTDLVVFRSQNSGANWAQVSSPHPALPNTDQYIPWMDTTPSGEIKMIWYDRRNDSTNLATEVFASSSNDGGINWQANVLVSSAPFLPPPTLSPNPDPIVADCYFIGEYNQIDTPNDSFAHVSWGDGRVLTTGAAPQPQPDVFYSRLVQDGARAIGGNMIPIDSTMVLAAGAQYTAAWMIPVIVSAIGIGIVIARKF